MGRIKYKHSEKIKKQISSNVRRTIEIKCLNCNKNFYVRPSECVRKFCTTLCSNSYHCKGKSPWNINKNHPKYKIFIEKVKKIGQQNGEPKKQYFCKQCKKEFFSYASGIKRKTCSKLCYGKYLSLHRKGKNNAMYKKGYKLKGNKNGRWNNGSSKKPYSFDFDEKLKEEIRNRDNRVCQICLITEKNNIKNTGDKLSIHHIDYCKKNSNKSNLISLCKVCHSITNNNRKIWGIFFQKLMNNKQYKNDKQQ